jgi:hypothetical protein
MQDIQKNADQAGEALVAEAPWAMQPHAAVA